MSGARIAVSRVAGAFPPLPAGASCGIINTGAARPVESADASPDRFARPHRRLRSPLRSAARRSPATSLCPRPRAEALKSACDKAGGKFSQGDKLYGCGTDCVGKPGTDCTVTCRTDQRCTAQVIGGRRPRCVADALTKRGRRREPCRGRTRGEVTMAPSRQEASAARHPSLLRELSYTRELAAETCR